MNPNNYEFYNFKIPPRTFYKRSFFISDKSTTVHISYNTSYDYVVKPVSIYDCSVKSSIHYIYVDSVCYNIRVAKIRVMYTDILGDDIK